MPEIDGTWTLHHEGQPVAYLIVTEIDFPWMRGRTELLPGFGTVAPLFEEQERLAEAEEYDPLDVVYDQIRAATSMTLPDGTQVAEYLLYIHADGTRGWRWHDEPFDDAADH